MEDDADVTSSRTPSDQVARLRRALAREISEREAERARFLAMLHDDVTPMLVLSQMLIPLLKEPIDGVREPLAWMEELTDRAAARLRAAMAELRQAPIRGLSLDTSIRAIARSTAERAALDETVDLGDLTRHPLHHDVEDAIIRTVQEATENIERHAEAGALSITGIRGGGLLRVEIADDGRGFDPDAVPPEAMGIWLMRERARAVGATLLIDSAPDSGTRVVIEVPR